MYSWGRDQSERFLQDLLEFCSRMKADAVAGPAMSGAVIAAAAGALASVKGEPLTALLLGKQGNLYQQSQHPSGPKVLYGGRDNVKQIVLVDDCACMGNTMSYAVSEVEEQWPEAEIVAVVTSGSFWPEAAQGLRERLPNAVFRKWTSRGGFQPQESR